jgi:hypothetical protein
MPYSQTFTQLLFVSTPAHPAAPRQDSHPRRDTAVDILPAAACSRSEPTPEFDATLRALQGQYPDLVASLAELDTQDHHTSEVTR